MNPLVASLIAAKAYLLGHGVHTDINRNDLEDRLLRAANHLSGEKGTPSELVRLTFYFLIIAESRHDSEHAMTYRARAKSYDQRCGAHIYRTYTRILAAPIGTNGQTIDLHDTRDNAAAVLQAAGIPRRLLGPRALRFIDELSLKAIMTRHGLWDLRNAAHGI